LDVAARFEHMVEDLRDADTQPVEAQLAYLDSLLSPIERSPNERARYRGLTVGAAKNSRV
jgi:hypothetical protein